MKIQLDMYQTIAVAVVVLMLGKFLKERVELLERFCIPAPVIGGVIFAIFTCLCYVTGIAEFSFDDILKDKKYQSEFDKRVAKALETAKGKWETDYQAKVEEAKTEAEKLAKMNAEQKAKYAEEKRLAELEKREKDITTRELRATAFETLAEKNLPKELVDILNYSDAEQCNKSIEAVEKAFQTAVERAVNEKLRGKQTPNKGGQGNAEDAALRKAMGL